MTFCDVSGYVACIHCVASGERIKHCLWCDVTVCDGCATVTYCISLSCD